MAPYSSYLNLGHDFTSSLKSWQEMKSYKFTSSSMWRICKFRFHVHQCHPLASDKPNMLYCIMKGGFLEQEIFVRQVVLHLCLHNLGARFSKINKLKQHFKKHLTNLQLTTTQLLQPIQWSNALQITTHGQYEIHICKWEDSMGMHGHV